MIPLEYLALRTVTTSGAVSSVLELTDMVQYALASYAPEVAPLRAATLGGQSAYVEATDALSLYAVGATAARAVANAEALVGVLDQAARWAREETVSAVYLALRVQGGTAGTLQAMCLGPADDSPPLAIDPQYDVLDACPGLWAQRVEVQVRRRGLWYVEAITTAGPATVTANGGTTTAFGAASPAQTPIATLLRLSTTTAVPASEVLYESALLVSGQVSAIAAGSFGSDTTPPTGYTRQNDSANLPSQGTFVLRFNPATANPATTNTYALATLNGSDLAFAVLVTARANAVSAAVSFLVTPKITTGGATFSGRPVEVAATSTDPRVVALGIVPVPYISANIQATLSVTVQAVGGTGVTLDLDAFAVAVLGAQTAIATIPQVTLTPSGDVSIVLDPCDLQGTLGEAVGSGGGAEAQGLAGRRPQVYAVNRVGGVLQNIQPLAYTGALPQADGAQVTALWLAVNPPYWDYVPTTTRVNHSLTFSRRIAYRTPQ